MERYEKLEIEVIIFDSNVDTIVESITTPTEVPPYSVSSTPNRSMFSSDLDYYAYLEDNNLDE